MCRQQKGNQGVLQHGHSLPSATVGLPSDQQTRAIFVAEKLQTPDNMGNIIFDMTQVNKKKKDETENASES